MDLKSYRKILNSQQSELRRVMKSERQHEKAEELFMQQHAMLHSAKASQSGLWSYEDFLLDDMEASDIRRIPPSEEHSIVWCVWHLARIEDVTMNMLVGNSEQVFETGNWQERMKATIKHTGNNLSYDEIVALGDGIDIAEMRNYRASVGKRTREIVRELEADLLGEMVSPNRLAKVIEQGAVVEAAQEIIDYWGKLSIAGLLLMPATRHNLLHLNEAMHLKQKGNN